MTNSPSSVRWLYSYLVHSVHSGVWLDMHDSLCMPIRTPAMSHLIGELLSEERA